MTDLIERFLDLVVGDHPHGLEDLAKLFLFQRNLPHFGSFWPTRVTYELVFKSLTACSTRTLTIAIDHFGLDRYWPQ